MPSDPDRMDAWDDESRSLVSDKEALSSKSALQKSESLVAFSITYERCPILWPFAEKTTLTMLYGSGGSDEQQDASEGLQKLLSNGSSSGTLS